VESAALFSEAPTITKRALQLAPSGIDIDLPRIAPGEEEQPALEQTLWHLIEGSGLTLAQAIGECERLLVRAALRAENNNRTRAAGRLGIHVRTIFKKLNGAP
jgi:DNA-binding NtrC family response regulator